ncbi:transposase [Streptomyces sp. SCL15-4]|uniref:transposase n=1 Tax=Streptomyces sp. SCL15-4 TaxID=2967221 RepID=UPI00398FD772
MAGQPSRLIYRPCPDRDSLTVFQLPSYAPDLDPVEGIWSVLRRTTTADHAFADPDDLITAVRRLLRRLHHRPDVLAAASPPPDSDASHHDGITHSSSVGNRCGMSLRCATVPVLANVHRHIAAHQRLPR